jgi:hypothetical protein
MSDTFTRQFIFLLLLKIITIDVSPSTKQDNLLKLNMLCIHSFYRYLPINNLVLYL